MPLERQTCQDCGFDLPLKQFARYRGQRHTLCRTCLAIDVAEFKAWVLPFVKDRRSRGEAPDRWEDWEIAVLNRAELTGHQRSAMILRPTPAILHRNCDPRRATRYFDPTVIRPWKYALVDA